MLAEQGDAGVAGPAHPRVREFGLTNQLLTRLVEAVQENTAATIATIPGGKPPRLEPLPRPETAADRLARRVSEASADYILDQIEAARRRSVDGGAVPDQLLE